MFTSLEKFTLQIGSRFTHDQWRTFVLRNEAIPFIYNELANLDYPTKVNFVKTVKSGIAAVRSGNIEPSNVYGSILDPSTIAAHEISSHLVGLASDANARHWADEIERVLPPVSISSFR